MSDQQTRGGATYDTRPLAEEWLSAEQQAFVGDLRRQVIALAETPPSEPIAAPRDDWMPRFDAEPVYRNLLIDGGRGTGKTSLMLTITQYFSRRERPRRVLVLQPIDFDPLPRHQGAYTWLVLGFMEICDRLDEAVGGPSSRYDDQPCREQSLRARWRELYRMALTGWGSFADRVADADIDDFIDDHRVAGQHWMRMREHWRAFIDALVEGCELRGWLARGGSLLLPIDDLDLTPHLGMDVLQALRHLQHPRLITLVTGDSHHLRQVVARQLLARELGDSRASDRALSRAEDETDALADAYVDKVLPIGTRLSPPAFGPTEAFRMATHRWRGADGGAWRDTEQADVDAWLGQAYRELKGEGADPDERLEAVEPVPGAPLLAEGFRIRDLAHALDGAAGERGTPQFAAALLMRLLDAFRVEREGRLSDRTFAQDLETTYHSYEAEMVPLDVRWTDGVGVARSVGLCLHGEAHGETHSLTLGPLARLRLRLELDTRRVGLKWRPVSWSPLVQSSPMGPSIAPLAWPSQQNKPWTWAMARDYLRYLGGTGGPSTKAGVMSGWLALHCEWITGSGLPVQTGELDEDAAFDGTLDAAFERMAGDNRWREWLLQIFPVLCAPAHGLSDETKYSILCRLAQQARRPGEWNAGVKSWKCLYGDASNEAGSRTGHLTPQQISEVRDTDPWQCVDQLARFGNWYDTPVDRRTSFADLLERSASSSLWPKSYLTQLLALDLPGKDRASRGRMVPHWGTRTLDATLADPRERLRFIRTVGGICESAPQRLLHVFVESWRALVRLHRLADEIGDWFDVTQNEGNLIWHGPRAIRLIPRLGEPLRMGELVVRRVEGWSVTGVDLPDALVGWLGIMQTLGFKQTRPDARFEAWVSPPSDLAVFDGDEWSLPPVDTWHRMEALATAWNNAIDRASEHRRGDAARVNLLTLRWLGLLRMHLISDGVLLSTDDWFLRALHVEPGDILQLKQNSLQAIRSGPYHRCFSWLSSLASHEPLHGAWQWDRVEPRPEGITTHIRNLQGTIDDLIGRTDVSEALGEIYADGPPASPGEVIDRVREKLGAAFTPYVERRLRDYFTVLPEQ